MQTALSNAQNKSARMVLIRNGCVHHPGIKESMPAHSRNIKRFNNARSYHPRSIQLSPLRVSSPSTPRASDSNRSFRRVRFVLPATNENSMRPSVASSTALVTTPTRFASRHSRAIRRPAIIAPIEIAQRRPYSESVVDVAVAASPGVRSRVHPTGRYLRGTLSPTANAPASPLGAGRILLKAAADGEDDLLRDLLRRASLTGIAEQELNAKDRSGRTILSHLASNGGVDIIERLLLLPGLNPNQADNEGNTPLHFAAQAGQAECLNCMLTRCKALDIDARNHMGFTPLMKAALQGRNKCAKLLLFAGANPTLKDNGRGLRADQWARFCGRYVCADVIEKHARQKLLERTTSYGNWGNTPVGKVVPTTQSSVVNHSGIRSKLKRVFRTSSSSSGGVTNESSSVRLVTQLTTAALCASTPVLPTAPSVPPVVKSLIRPLTVPRLQITLANCENNSKDYNCKMSSDRQMQHVTHTTVRTKKKSK